MVTLVYDGSKQPIHLREFVSFKGFRIESGKSIELPADIAGHFVATQPEGTVTVKSGTPTPWAKMSASAREAVKREQNRARMFPTDPAKALEGLNPLPADALKATVADIDGGKVDAHLAGLAVWAQLGGKADLAKAAVRRSEALRRKA